eukprot:c25520_g1_i1 orf=2-2146(-)
MMELVLRPAIYHDATSSKHGNPPQTTHHTLQVEAWWPSVWARVNPSGVKYEASHPRRRAAQSLGMREASVGSEAFEEFASGVCKPEVLSWREIILENVNSGKNIQALNLYREMRESKNVQPDEQIFVPLLKACSSMEIIEQGKWVHSHIIETGLESDPYISCTLIDMYVKCGRLEEAQCAFDALPTRLVETWNALIAGYTHYQIGDEGLKLFKQMQCEGIKPSRVTFICVLKACSSMEDLDQGRQIHAFLIESGLEVAVFVENALIDMYVKCVSLDDAHVVFSRLSTPDVTACNTLIGGYAQEGSLQTAFVLLKHMQEKGIRFDQITFVCILKACCNLESLQHGRHIHAIVVDFGLELDELVGNSLMHMYTCCESFEDAKTLFNKMPQQNVVMWTTLIAGYAQSGQGLDALELLGQMRHQGVEPNEVTYISVLKGCANLSAFEKGRSVHADLIEGGHERYTHIGNALIDMYGKCGSLQHARIAFEQTLVRNLVTWTTMISLCVQHGQSEVAFQLYSQMCQEGVLPERVTFLVILAACVSRVLLPNGERILVCLSGGDDEVVMTEVVNMYGRCGSIENARKVFDAISSRDVVAWNTMISVYSQHAEDHEVFKLFEQMLSKDITPTTVTCVSMLGACIRVMEGKILHAYIMENKFETGQIMSNAIVTMYGKSGNIEDAWSTFISMARWDVISWNAMISAYALNGKMAQALGLFEEMA